MRSRNILLTAEHLTRFMGIKRDVILSEAKNL